MTKFLDNTLIIKNWGEFFWVYTYVKQYNLILYFLQRDWEN
jgi:hypothetical protein